MNVRFNAEDHTYWCGEEKIPGVTTIIETVCQSFASIPDQLLIPAQERGTAVHKATELDDLEILDIDSLDADLHGYLEAWRKFRATHKFEPDRIEALLAHPKLRYAGQADRIGKITWNKRRQNVLLDIKTGQPAAGTALQTAAYLDAHKEMTGAKTKLRMSVHLRENGEYRVVEYKDPSDLRCFRAMLTAYRWMTENVNGKT